MEVQAGRGPRAGPRPTPSSYPIQPKRHSVRVPAHAGAPAAADQHLRGRRARPQRPVGRHPRVLPAARLRLYIHTPIITASDCEGAGELFRVTTLDPPSRPATRPGRWRLRPGLLRPLDLSDGVSGNWRPRPTPARWATSTPSGRRSGRRTPTRPATWRSSGWSSRRWPSATWPATPTWPRTFLKYLFRGGARALRGGHGLLQRADRQDGHRHADAHRRERASSGCTYTEAMELLTKADRQVGLPAAVGPRPPDRTRAVPHRGDLRQARDPDGLPGPHQAVLHAAQRRRADGGGDGRAGAEDRRDHRRQPARGAAGRAGRADGRPGA